MTTNIECIGYRSNNPIFKITCTCGQSLTASMHQHFVTCGCGKRWQVNIEAVEQKPKRGRKAGPSETK